MRGVAFILLLTIVALVSLFWDPAEPKVGDVPGVVISKKNPSAEHADELTPPEQSPSKAQDHREEAHQEGRPYQYD